MSLTDGVIQLKSDGSLKQTPCQDLDPLKEQFISSLLSKMQLLNCKANNIVWL